MPEGRDGAGARQKVGSVLTVILGSTVKTSEAFAALALLLMLVVILGGVVGRTFLGSPLIENHEELSGYLLVGFVFFGLPASFESGAFVRVSLGFNRLPIKARARVEHGLLAIATLYLVVLAYFSWTLAVRSLHFGTVSVGGSGILLYVPQGLMAVGATLFCFYLAVKTVIAVLLSKVPDAMDGE